MATRPDAATEARDDRASPSSVVGIAPAPPTRRVAVDAEPGFTSPDMLDRTASFPRAAIVDPPAPTLPVDLPTSGSPKRTESLRSSTSLETSAALASSSDQPTMVDGPSEVASEPSSLVATRQPTALPPVPQDLAERESPSPQSSSTVASPAAPASPSAEPLDAENEPTPASPASPSPAMAPIASDWPTSPTLQQLLAQLDPKSAQLAAWRNDVQLTLNALLPTPMEDLDEVEQRMGQLSQLAEVTERLETYATGPEKILLRRIRYGLERRVALWTLAARLHGEQLQSPFAVDPAADLPTLDSLHAWLARRADGASWRDYLMLDSLRRVASEPWVTNPDVRRSVAREVLKRMDASTLTPAQQQFLAQPAVAPLRDRLTSWSAQPTDVPALVAALELFETKQTSTVAGRVQATADALRYSPYASASSLQSALETHYRNANLRLVVTERLLNDLLPALEPSQQEVRDNILGAEVRGQNSTWTDLHVDLIEDPAQIHLRLEADGRTRSRTVSSKGPVRLFSRDASNFRAGKDLLVSARGVQVTPAVSESSGNSQVLDIRTQFDNIPVLGWMVRQIAADEHERSRDQVRLEVGARINTRARTQLDETVSTRLLEAEQKFNDKVLAPLRELHLDPKAVEMRTTDHELVVRGRLAGSTQLAAYTPRPRALSNSVLSFQLHESAPNNLLQQLQLEDQRIELEELIERLSQHLKINRQDIHEELPEGVVVRMGRERPIEVEFEEDRILVTLRLAELKTSRRTWRNFEVRARYKPCMCHSYVDLEREGGIELISEKLGLRDQVALRGIFTKVMTRNHRLNLLKGRFEQDARLANLGVTQFEARDGWLGVSIGPQERPKIATESATEPISR
jgi:hypothetical protein